MANQFTVKELYLHLGDVLSKKPSLANKKIVISDDNEGNGFHGMFFGITDDVKGMEDLVYDSTTTNPKDFVILG